MFKSWVFALRSMAGLEMPPLACDLSTEGRTVEKAAVRLFKVLVSVVPTWPIGKYGDELHPSLVFSESRDKGGVLLGIFVELGVASEVPAKADLDEDECALFFVEGGRVGRESVWDPSCVDDVR
jgi:hypothetical protein